MQSAAGSETECERLKTFLTNLATCPVCLAVPDRDKSECLYMCINGHFVCGPCGIAMEKQRTCSRASGVTARLSGLQKCPVCRTGSTLILRSPHYIMTSLLTEAGKGYTFFCDNAGCAHQAVGEQQIALHKSVCPQKRLRCPAEGCAKTVRQAELYDEATLRHHPCYVVLDEPALPLDDDARVRAWETVVNLWSIWHPEHGRVTNVFRERPRVLRDPQDEALMAYVGFRTSGLGNGLTIFVGWLDKTWDDSKDPNKTYRFKLHVASMFPDGSRQMSEIESSSLRLSQERLLVGNSKEDDDYESAGPDDQDALHVMTFVGSNSYKRAANTALSLGKRDKRYGPDSLDRLSRLFNQERPFAFKRYLPSGPRFFGGRQLALDFDFRLDAGTGIRGSKRPMVFFVRDVPLRYIFLGHPHLGGEEDRRRAKVQFGNLEYLKSKVVRAASPPPLGFELLGTGSHLDESGITISKEMMRLLIKRSCAKSRACSQCDSKVAHLHITVFCEKKNA